MSEILDKGASYQKALGLIEFLDENVSKKIACLKAAKRMKLHMIDDFILVTSRINAFEASSANRILSIGGTCAFVGSIEKDTIWISERASQNFLKKTKINLGKDVMPHVGKFAGGSGGGHSEAAGAKSREGDIDSALNECINITKDLITHNRA